MEVADFRELLEQDNIFTDYLNAFLNLPFFARRLTYCAVGSLFFIEPQVDSKIYTIDEDCVISWVGSHRLPLFFKSELFYEYKLCYALNCQNEALEGCDSEMLETVSAMYEFKKFLFQTEGEGLYLFWMDVEHLKTQQSQFYTRKLIIRISHTYIADGGSFQLISALRDDLVAVQKIDEPQNRWNTMQQVKELVKCQTQVLATLREYWCKRYVLNHREESGYSKEKRIGSQESALTRARRGNWVSAPGTGRSKPESRGGRLSAPAKATSSGKPSTPARRPKPNGRQTAPTRARKQFSPVKLRRESTTPNEESVLIRASLKHGSRWSVTSPTEARPGCNRLSAPPSIRYPSIRELVKTRSTESALVKVSMSRRQSTPAAARPTPTSRQSAPTRPKPSRLSSLAESRPCFRLSAPAGLRPSSRKSVPDRARASSRGSEASSCSRLSAPARVGSSSSGESYMPRAASARAILYSRKSTQAPGSEEESTQPQARPRSEGGSRPQTMPGSEGESIRSQTKPGSEEFSPIQAWSSSRESTPIRASTGGREEEEGYENPLLDNLPMMASSESIGEDGARRVSHIKISTSKVPYLFSGERNVVTNAVSNDALAKSTILARSEPSALVTSSMYDLFSASCHSPILPEEPEVVQSKEEREKQEDFDVEPYLRAAMRADFTGGNCFLRYLKNRKSSTKTVSYLLFWQSVENILTQDEMRRWYTSWSLRNHEEERPCPYLSYFEPLLVAKNLEELCLFFLQPRSLHKVTLPPEMEDALRMLLPKGLGQGLLLAAQDSVVKNLMEPWKEYLHDDYEQFIKNCSTEKYSTSMAAKGNRLQSITVEKVIQDAYSTSSLKLSTMWNALKHSEAIKYAGIHQLPSRDFSAQSLHRLCAGAPDVSCPKQHAPSSDGEVEVWQDLCATPSLDLYSLPLVTTVAEKVVWDKEHMKLTRRKLFTSTPKLTPSPIKRKPQHMPQNMLEVLRDKEHLEYFRNFLASKGAVASDMPIQFWLAVEELKRCVHNRMLYLEKLRKIEERFLKGKILSETFGKQDFLQHTTPEGNDPELFKLITAQATIRMALEGKWLEEYVAYLEHEEEKKRELQKNWEAERLSRLLRRKELERAKNKRTIWRTLAHLVACFKKDMMTTTTCYVFQKFLYDEVMRMGKLESRRASVAAGRLVTITKLLRDLGFWTEVERYKDLVMMVKEEKTKETQNPEDLILVHKKAHAIVNCYMDSTIQPKIQVNATTSTVDTILKKVAVGDISYGLFHKAAMEIFHILFPYWRNFCNQTQRVSAKSSRSKATPSSSQRSMLVDTNDSSTNYKHFCFDRGSVLSFSLMFGLRLMYPGLSVPIPMRNCEILPGSTSFPSLAQIMNMACTRTK